MVPATTEALEPSHLGRLLFHPDLGSRGPEGATQHGWIVCVRESTERRGSRAHGLLHRWSVLVEPGSPGLPMLPLAPTDSPSATSLFTQATSLFT